MARFSDEWLTELLNKNDIVGRDIPVCFPKGKRRQALGSLPFPS